MRFPQGARESDNVEDATGRLAPRPRLVDKGDWADAPGPAAVDNPRPPNVPTPGVQPHGVNDHEGGAY